MPICSLCDVLPEKGDCIPVLPVFITNRLAKSEFVITLVSSIYAVPLSWIPRVCVLSGDRRAVLYVDLIIASAKLLFSIITELSEKQQKERNYEIFSSIEQYEKGYPNETAVLGWILVLGSGEGNSRYVHKG